MLSNTDTVMLERLEKSMGDGFRELKNMVSELDQRLRTIETTEIGLRQVQDLRVSQLETRIAETFSQHEKKQAQRDSQIVGLDDRISALEPWVRGMRWLVGILGASVLMLLWGILTHTITLTMH